MRNENILDDHLIQKQIPILFKNWVLLIWGIFLFVGLIFKIIHWPGGSSIIIITTVGISSYSLNGFLLKSQRTSINTVFAALSILWASFLLWGVIFNNNHPYNINGLTLFLVSTLIFYAITLMVFKIKLNRLKKKQATQDQ